MGSRSSGSESDAESRDIDVEKANRSNNDKWQNSDRSGIEAIGFADSSLNGRPKRSSNWDKTQVPVQELSAHRQPRDAQRLIRAQQTDSTTYPRIQHASFDKLSVKSGSREASPSRDRRSPGSAIASEPKHPEIRPEGLQQWVLQHHKENIIKEIDGDHLENQIWDFIVSWLLPTGIARKLLSNINGSKMSDSGPIFRISFAELQRMRMRKLEVQLIKHAVHMAKFGVEPQGWENDLATYVQAAKDHDFMLDYSKRPRDVFVATGERQIDRFVTASVIDAATRDSLHLGKKIPPRERWEPEGKGRPIPDTRPSVLRRTSIQDFAHRIMLAVVGGALLVGPMWLMVLQNTLYTGLVTTTVCVGIFGLFTSLTLDKPLDVLSSTAAYAAVLVVFVGFQNSDKTS